MGTATHWHRVTHRSANTGPGPQGACLALRCPLIQGIVVPQNAHQAFGSLWGLYDCHSAHQPLVWRHTATVQSAAPTETTQNKPVLKPHPLFRENLSPLGPGQSFQIPAFPPNTPQGPRPRECTPLSEGPSRVPSPLETQPASGQDRAPKAQPRPAPDRRCHTASGDSASLVLEFRWGRSLGPSWLSDEARRGRQLWDVEEPAGQGSGCPPAQRETGTGQGTAEQGRGL